jgi:hypothetical protein
MHQKFSPKPINSTQRTSIQSGDFHHHDKYSNLEMGSNGRRIEDPKNCSITPENMVV